MPCPVPSRRRAARTQLASLAALALLALPAAATAQQAAAPKVTVLKAARMFDGTGAPLVRDAAVVVTGDRITAAGPAAKVAIPAGATVVDLGDATLLPGFIDMHVHIIGRTIADPKADDQLSRDYRAYGAILGVENARKTLMAGFTTVRVLGAPDFDDIALRQAISDGQVPGPRSQNAANSFGITGGHCDENGYRPGLFDATYKNGAADGVDEVRKAVRYQVKYGADVIKICATGGVLSEGDAVGATQYTLEEMQAIVEEARKLDRKVAAHAHGTEGIILAVKAGVASIEHGSFLDEEGAKLMAQKGTFLVPTLQAAETVNEAVDKGRLTGLRAQKAKAAWNAGPARIKLALKYNIPVALGTDAGVGLHGRNAEEFGLMVRAGLSPVQALVAGTSNAAKLLGWSDRVGTLAEGRYADIVAVPGDPTADISATMHPAFVMKGGVTYLGAGAH